jgi:hypothetical protein
MNMRVKGEREGFRRRERKVKENDSERGLTRERGVKIL